MLRFKQFIKEFYLIEAKAEHFNNVKLNPENPEHKDLIDAYNNGLSAESGNKNVTKLPKPGQIKSIEQFKDAVKPHLDAINQKRKEAADDKDAYDTGRATVIHHNPETGLTITQVGNQASSVATNPPSPHCTSQRNAKSDMIKKYKGENNSFQISAPKEKNKDLSHIAAIGDYAENKDTHQGKNNHKVLDTEWSEFENRHELNNVKHLKGSMRGIGITEAEKDQYSKELTHNIKNGTVSTPDVAHAKHNGYLTDDHKNALLDDKTTKPGILDKLASDKDLHERILKHPNTDDTTLGEVAENSNDQEVHLAIAQHKNAEDKVLAEVGKKSNDPEVHMAILAHENIGDKALAAVAEKYKYPKLHKGILEHKNAGENALAAVAENSSDPEVHEKILAHKNAGDNALAAVAEKLKGPEVHEKILAHKNAGDNALAAVAENSNDLEVHKAIVAHENAGDYALGRVAENSNDPEVHKAIELKRKTLHSHILGLG